MKLKMLDILIRILEKYMHKRHLKKSTSVLKKAASNPDKGNDIYPLW